MIYRKLGRTGLEISAFSMGGHEYLPDGRSRGFNEDFTLAIKPGYLFEGFGRERRRQILSIAFDNGINFFDVTQDSEKEALGRNLKEIPPPYEIYIQTRPEGMVYTYDPYNRKMADYDLLKTEVERILKLLQRDHLEFLNLESTATVVLTDSGGLQEETTILGVPCLTLRHNTERPVTLTSGTNTLVYSGGGSCGIGWKRSCRISVVPPGGFTPFTRMTDSRPRRCARSSISSSPGSAATPSAPPLPAAKPRRQDALNGPMRSTVETGYRSSGPRRARRSAGSRASAATTAPPAARAPRARS